VHIKHNWVQYQASLTNVTATYSVNGLFIKGYHMLYAYHKGTCKTLVTTDEPHHNSEVEDEEGTQPWRSR
jgi:hypothetical protein